MLQAHGPDEPLKIIGLHVRGEDITLGTGRACDVVSDSTVEDCTVSLTNANAVLLSGSRFLNCRIRPRRLVRTSWNATAWDGCDFRGRYSSTHFGIGTPDSGPAA